MKVEYTMRMRDANEIPPDRDFAPFLKGLENRMYNSLIRTPGTYVKKRWLSSRSKTEVRILEGIKRYNPNSGETKVTLQILIVPTAKTFDPLHHGH